MFSLKKDGDGEKISDPTRGEVIKVDSPFGTVTSQFLEQIERYRLHFSCDECANFDTEMGECLYRYPTEIHRRAAIFPSKSGELKKFIFCREFELI